MKKFLIAAAAAAGAVTFSAAPAMAAPVATYGASPVASYGLTYNAPVVHQVRGGFDNDWQRRGYGDDRWNNGRQDRFDRRDDRRFDRRFDRRDIRRNQRFDDYRDQRQVRGWNGQSWRGDDGRYYCRRDNGTTGLVIGAGLGALAGRTIDTRGDRSAGTLLGAIAGGLLGREIDRGELRCR